MLKLITEAGLKALPQGEYWDTKLSGFGVRVGRRTTTFLFKQHNSRVKVGHWPLMSLQAARKKAYTLKAGGADQNADMPLEDAIRLFLATHCVNYRPRTRQEAERHLKRLHRLYKRRLGSITTYELLHLIDGLISTPSEANHFFKVCRTFFRFCVRRRLIQHSPLVGLAIPNRETSRSRVLSDTELQLIWRACEENRAHSEGHRPNNNRNIVHEGTRLPSHFATIVKLLILTAQRRGEIAALRASYFHPSISSSDPSSLSNTNFICTLPPTLTKNSREHTFPIAPLTLSLLNKLATSSTSGMLFPARGVPNRPFNGWSKAKAQLDQLSGVSGYTLHDIRRTVATRLAEMGTAPHIIERILNHATGQISGVAAIYNRASYLEEMRQALTAWEQKLVSLCTVGGK